MTLVEQIRESVTKNICLLNTRESADRQLNIGFGIDVLYARPMGVAMTSIAVNNPSLHFIFHVFESSIEDEDVERLNQLVKIHPNISLKLYHVDETVISHLPVIKHFTLAMYFRLMIPLVLDDVKRILYLDSDILCLNDISSLVDISLNHSVCAAVLDAQYVRDEKVIELDLKEGKYFNSGVLLIDIPKWNERQISEQVISILASAKEYLSLPDQDALNVVLEGKVFYLSSKWNCLPDDYRDYAVGNLDFQNSIIFLHCTFHPKPWKAACRSPLQAYYLSYEKCSPWAEQSLIPPATYREARLYANLLLKKGKLSDSLAWYIKYISMKAKFKFFAK